MLAVALLMVAVVPSWLAAQPGVPDYGIGGLDSQPGMGVVADQSSGQVALTVVNPYQKAPAVEPFAVAVQLDIPTGWHLYANPRRGNAGYDTELKASPAEGLIFGEPIYPEGSLYKDKASGDSYYIYKGLTTIWLPVKVIDGSGLDSSSDRALGPIRLTVTGLMCSDTSCQPWEDTVTVDELVVSDEPVNAVLADELAGMFSQVNLREAFAAVAAESKAAGASTEQGREATVEDATGQSVGADETPAGSGTADSASNAAGQAGGSTGEIDDDAWLFAIGMALLAGIVMNVMPCVLPIIPIVIATLMNQCASAEGEKPDRGKSIRVGLSFAAGIMAVFIALAVVMSIFKLSWGQQFQSDTFKLILVMVVFVLGLSMFGLFEITLPSNVSNITVVRKGYLGAFLMGMLATVLATPCGAPLLGPVLFWSLSKPVMITVVVFIVIGVGMAAPYVLLTAFPQLMNRLPRAGNWMIRLKQGIGFALMAFTVYLVGLFPPGRMISLLYFCTILGFTVWMAFTLVGYSTPRGKRIVLRLLALAITVLSGWALLGSHEGVASPGASATAPGRAAGPNAVGETPWSQLYWQDQVTEARNAGKVVVVKMTANWCKNCKVLDKTIYKTDAFAQLLADHNGVLVIADWSQSDPQIKATLNRYASKSIPFALVYPSAPSADPIVLRDGYGRDDIWAAVKTAAE